MPRACFVPQSTQIKTNMTKFKKWIKILLAILAIVTISVAGLSRCTYSNGARIGTVIKFSQKGLGIPGFKSYEGTLQIGQKSSDMWNFSVSDEVVINQLQAAMNNQVQVKLVYKQYLFSDKTKDTAYRIMEVIPVHGPVVIPK